MLGPHRRLAAAVLTVLALGATAACGDDGGSGTTAQATEPGKKSSPMESSSSGGDSGQCSFPDAGQAAKKVDKPSGQPLTGTTELTMTTNQGDLHLSLDADKTPCTVTSFVSLAKQGYFDGTSCHRLTTQGIQVLQCGDPTGTGAGGPGYSFADELSGKETYPPGTLAMANAGPNTNGSQFFFVYGPTPLPPAYTVFGSVDDDSLRILQKVAKAGTDEANGPGDGHPNTAVDIEKVTVGS